MSRPGATMAGTVPAGTATGRVDVLRARLRAMSRFVELVGDRVPPERLRPARELSGRAGRRLELSGRHTVVALAGTTGSGKSSLFNAISGLDLSRTAVRRPTTSEMHACVWSPEGADELLDWLGVPQRTRTARESALDGDDEAMLRGLVLLDLPDFDSVDAGHRAVVDRLIGVVDLVIWVMDPQKYADRTVHEGYLRTLVGRDAPTAVVLNQIDRLSVDDALRCAHDLRRLLVADGLPEVPLYLTSARTREGVPALRVALAEAVVDRRTAVRRLASDLTAVAGGLVDLTGGGRHQAAVDEPPPADELCAELATAAGVPGLLDGAEHDYRRRGRRATGWLFSRWALRGRDPKRRLEQERYDLDWLDPGGDDEPPAEAPAATGDREPSPPGPIRKYLVPVVNTLPDVWRTSVRTTVRAGSARLAERLAELPERAAARPRPTWWSVLNVAQWLLGACAVAGAVWWLVSALAGPLRYSAVPVPSLGAVPLTAVLLVGGVLLGILLAVVAAPAVRASAREYRDGLEAELTAEVSSAVRTGVVDPLAEELHICGQARAALAEAAG